MPDLTVSANVDALLQAADFAAFRATLGLGSLATQNGTFSGSSSGTNTGDQTDIPGNAGTVSSIGNLTGVVTSVNRATSIADGALSIAKTSGLQTALDGKVPTSRTVNGQALSGNVTITDVTGNAGTVTTINGRIAAGSNVTITGSGTAASPYTINATGGGGGGGGDALTSGTLAQFAATTSAQLAGVISDETGTGALVFANSPTLVTPALGTPASGNLANCTFPSSLVTLTGTQTLTNKTLTSPTFTAPVLGTPASGNLANCTFPTLNQSTTGNAATVTTINGRISAGTNVTLSGSGTAADPYVINSSGGGGGGGGDASTNTASSVDSEVALFSGTGGKTLKRATGSGVAKLSSGVLSTSNVSLSSEVTGTLPVANGGTGRTTATTAYGIIAAGTTATGNQQTIAPGTAGHFLKSAGPSALAGFSAITTSDVSGLSAALDGKVDKVAGKGLSQNDYTDAEKSKLAGYPDTPTSQSALASVDALALRDGAGRIVARGYRIFDDESGTKKTDVVSVATADRAHILPDKTGTLAHTSDIAEFTAEQTLTDGATVTYNCNNGWNAKWTIGGDRTLSIPTNAPDGASGRVVITQDGTGGRALTLASGWGLTTANLADVAAMTAGKQAVLSWTRLTSSTFASTLIIVP